jgi:2-keto-4-pentenoate hydratase
MINPAVVRHLFEARRDGTPVGLSSGQMTPEEALATQLAVSDLFVGEGDGIAGWKVGFTSGRSRNRMGAEFRPFGYLLASRCLGSGGTVTVDRRLDRAIEPELCVILGKDLAGHDVDEQAARSACRAVAAAFELNEYRVPGGIAGAPDLMLADGLANWGVVTGEEVPVESFRLEGTTVEFSCDQTVVATATAGVDLEIDSPFLSVSRLCRALAGHGYKLHVGDVVITGSFAARPVSGPGGWSARFSGVGEVSFQFG